MTNRKKDNLCGWLLGSLPLIGFAIFMLVPILFSVVMSFNAFPTNSYSFSDMTSVGFQNFAYMFSDPRLWKSLGNTFIYCLSIPFEMFFGLLFAYILRKKFFGRRFFRIVFFLPHICSLVALSYAWQYIFNPQDFGLLNQILNTFHIPQQSWLADPKQFKICVIVVTIWSVFGMNVLLYTASLNSISPTIYEAAELDGAGPFTKFFRIVVPLVTPISFYILMTAVIGGLQVYQRPDTMNIDTYRMGPGDSGLSLVGYMMYAKKYPVENGGLGVAAASSLFIAVVIILFTVLNKTISKKWVNYND